MIHKWNTPYEWFEGYIESIPENELKIMVLEFAKSLGNDAILDEFQRTMMDDGYFDNNDEDKECPFCGCVTTECPECGIVDDHGRISHCPEPACKEVNAPMQCVHCGHVVSEDLSGVLDFDQSLRKYD